MVSRRQSERFRVSTRQLLQYIGRVGMLSLNRFQHFGINKALRRPALRHTARSRPIAHVQSLEDRLCLSASPGTALIAAASSPPTVSVPASETVTKNTAFTFSSANGDAITFTDPGLAAGGFDTVTLTVGHGVLLLGSPGSISLLSGANNSASMTIKGTLPNLITALNGLSYTPISNFVGSDSLTVKISNTGDGLSASASTAITVSSATGSAPTVSAPASETITENTAMSFSSANGDPITFTDASLSASGVDEVALLVSHGKLLLGSTGSISLLAGENNSGSMTIAGRSE